MGAFAHITFLPAILQCPWRTASEPSSRFPRSSFSSTHRYLLVIGAKFIMPPCARPEKPPIMKLDFLSHPFYSTHPNAEKRLTMWKERIGIIAKNKHHYLAIQLPPFHNELIRHKAELVRYAEEKLGKERVIVKEDIRDGILDIMRTHLDLHKRIKEIGYDPSRIKINLYGETPQQCIPDAIATFITKIVEPKRVRQASRVLMSLCCDYYSLYRDKDKSRWGVPEVRNEYKKARRPE